MEYLKCNACGREYSDAASIETAKKMAAKNKSLFGFPIAPCPNMECNGDLELKESEQNE